VDWSGNPIDQNQMQQQPTGYMNNAYSSPTSFQSQPTGYQNGSSNGFGTQPTGFDPYAQQQQSFQPQQTGFNPYTQQNSSPFPQQQQQQPAEPLIPAGTNNPWATNQQQQAQSIKPMQTGSNNPFASSFGRPQTSSTPLKPTLTTLQEQKMMSQFNSTPSFNPPASFTPPQKEQTPHEAKLNALLSSGDGMDTFGNTGNLRIPAQHTAPGTFVNSAGVGLGRVHEQQNGNNPFLQSQFTGVPQTTYGGNSSSGFSSNSFGSAGHQIPAATGPAGMSNGFGGGYSSQQSSSNPFGAGPQQGQNGQGQDLIQF
jgi:epsin